MIRYNLASQNFDIFRLQIIGMLKNIKVTLPSVLDHMLMLAA